MQSTDVKVKLRMVKFCQTAFCDDTVMRGTVVFRQAKCRDGRVGCSTVRRRDGVARYCSL